MTGVQTCALPILSGSEGDRSSALYHFFTDRYMDAYVAEVKSFIHTIEKGEPPLVSGRDGKIPVVMGYAAKLSLAENRPVRMDEIDPGLKP